MKRKPFKPERFYYVPVDRAGHVFAGFITATMEPYTVREIKALIREYPIQNIRLARVRITELPAKRRRK